MSKPSVGDHVQYFYSPGQEEKPRAAIVTWVFSESRVNLCVFSPDGHPTGKQKILLLKSGEPRPELEDYCRIHA